MEAFTVVSQGNDSLPSKGAAAIYCNDTLGNGTPKHLKSTWTQGLSWV